MKLKTSNIQAIEKAESVTYPTLDLLLVGTESACGLLENLKYLKEPLSSDKHSFKSVFGLNTKFYYVIHKYKQKEVTNIEIGIGYLVEEDNKIFLKRARPMAFKQTNGPITSTQIAVDVFRPQSEDEYLIVNSYAPTLLTELLVDPNCIIYSSESCPINVLSVDTNSIIARLDDDITSLPISDLSEQTLELLLTYTKQIVLDCSQLDVKKLKTSCLQLKPSSRSGAKEGSIIYNSSNKCIEYYTGSEWRTLTWELSSDS